MTEAIEKDPFDEAFESAGALEANPPAEKPVEAAPAPVETPEATDAPTEPEAVSEAPEAASEAPKTETEAPAETKPEAKVPDEDILRRFAEIVERRKAEQPAPTPQNVGQPQPQAEAPALYNADEVKALQTFEKDWPDVASAMKLFMRGIDAQMKQNTGYIFQEFAKHMTPIMSETRSLAEMQRVSELRSYEPQYDDLEPKIVGWVQSQPDYLRQPFERVIQQGTLDEVKHLIQTYKAFNVPQASPAPKVTELSPVAKKAAIALAPVSSKRSDPPRAGAVSFDDAWEEAKRSA